MQKLLAEAMHTQAVSLGKLFANILNMHCQRQAIREFRNAVPHEVSM